MRPVFWTQAPMIRLLIPLTLGIGIAVKCPVNGYFGLLGVCSCVLIIPVLPVWKWPYPLRWIPGLALNLCVGILGILMQITHNEFFQEHHFIYARSPVQCMVRITDQGTAKKSTTRYGAEVVATLNAENNWLPAKGNLLLYIRNDTFQNASIFSYGDIIAFSYNHIKEVSPPSNPNEFNYKWTLAVQNIHFTAYLEGHDIQRSNYSCGNSIQVWVYRLQHYFTRMLNRYIGKASETAVVQALLYGYDDDIDPEVAWAFAQTGTLHVLAVSGMHVGMIFLILSFLLKPLNRNRKLKGLKNLLLLSALWFYAALCGLTPSILRATVMFSFILFGSMMKRGGNIFNTLGASAFFLLCFDPGMLFNTGFQLSYLAVGGIVLYHPMIFEWYTPTSRPGLEIWKILSVSLSAQLTTFPVSLLFFHQFPFCFLLSNLLMIPLTSIILYGAIVLLVVSGIPFAAEWLGLLLRHLVDFTNKTVILLSRLPFAYIDRIPLDLLQCALLYTLLIFFTLFFARPKRLYLILCLVSIITFILLAGIYQFRDSKQYFLTVYKIPKQTVLCLAQGNEQFLWSDSSFLCDEKQQQYYIRGHALARRLGAPHSYALNDSWKQIKMGNEQILINGKGIPNSKPNAVTILILRTPVDTHLLTNWPVRQVILTSSIKPLNSRSLKLYFNRRHIPCYAVSDSGAITLNLRNYVEQSGTLSLERPGRLYYP